MFKDEFKRVKFNYYITKNDHTFHDSCSYDFKLSKHRLNDWIKSKIESLALIDITVTSYIIYDVTEVFVKSVTVGDTGGEQLEI